MEIKSSEQIASTTAQIIKSKCSNIGRYDVNPTGTTNIAGVKGAAEVIAEINKMHLNYKQCLNDDAQAIKSIGRSFSMADKELATKY